MSTTQATNGKNNDDKDFHTWEKERIKTHAHVNEMILNPIMLFAELLRGNKEEKGMSFDMDEIGAVIRLLALGGLAQTMTHGHFYYADSDVLEVMFKDFAAAVRRHKDGAA